MFPPPLGGGQGEGPCIRDAAGDRTRGHGGGARQVRARLRALPPLEVAVGGADGAQVGEAVVADVAAEAARRLVPLEARLLEDAVEPFGLGRMFHGR